MNKHTKFIIKATGRTYTVTEVIVLEQHLKDGRKMPYVLKDFVPDSDRLEPLVFYVAKPMVGQEIYVGYETKEDVENLFKACKVNVDLKRYHTMEEIEILR